MERKKTAGWRNDPRFKTARAMFLTKDWSAQAAASYCFTAKSTFYGWLHAAEAEEAAERANDDHAGAVAIHAIASIGGGGS